MTQTIEIALTPSEATPAVQDTFTTMDPHLRLPDPLIESTAMGAEFIYVMKHFFSRSVTFTLSHPCDSCKSVAGQQPQYLGVRSPLRALGTNFLIAPSHAESFSFGTWAPSTSEEIATCSYLENALHKILTVFADAFHVRECEFLQALIYLERVMTSTAGSSSLKLDTNNFHLALITSVILANKMSADTPFTTGAWAKYFKIPLETIAEWERYFVNTLKCAFSVTEEEYLGASYMKWKLLNMYRASQHSALVIAHAQH